MAARVLPWLYLGGKKEAKDLDALKRLGIKRVLNVTPCVGRLPLACVFIGCVPLRVTLTHVAACVGAGVITLLIRGAPERVLWTRSLGCQTISKRLARSSTAGAPCLTTAARM